MVEYAQLNFFLLTIRCIKLYNIRKENNRIMQNSKHLDEDWMANKTATVDWTTVVTWLCPTVGQYKLTKSLITIF